jgi:hypothetical protein
MRKVTSFGCTDIVQPKSRGMDIDHGNVRDQTSQSAI